MCGICGIYYIDKQHTAEEVILKKMCASIYHRGPDDEGIFFYQNMGIGMRRLSIIDVGSGHQPIFNEDKSLVIVFNGEIYNYKEIKEELQKRGHKFSTNSDTETILHAYEEYGESCLNMLNGMFAIAILNTKTSELFIARDRIGIKPLYYYSSVDKFIFGSELKAILSHPGVECTMNDCALDLYLSYMFIPQPYSIYNNIYKLEPGHYLRISSKGIENHKYWDIDFLPDYKKTENDFINEFRDLFDDSVKKQMLSEVPFGAFLSGGIDSSSIVATMSKFTNAPIKTFSIGFEEGGYHDETKYAEQIAQLYKTDHHTFKVSANILQLMDGYMNQFDEPFADYAAFPTYIVSKLAREHVKVVLTGDGGDELFGGYDRYKYEMYIEQYKKIPSFLRRGLIVPFFQIGKFVSSPDSRMNQIFSAALRRDQQCGMESNIRYLSSFHKFTSTQKTDLLCNPLLQKGFSNTSLMKYWRKDYDFLQQRLYFDQKTNLPEDMLTKVDRTTMAVSLEARVPFLDHRIIEFAATIPSSLQIKNGQLKNFLKKAFADRLPRNIINRSKHGFSQPIDAWFRNELKEYVSDHLSQNVIKNSEIFNKKYVQQLLLNHMQGKENNGEKLFMILVVMLWNKKQKN